MLRRMGLPLHDADRAVHRFMGCSFCLVCETLTRHSPSYSITVNRPVADPGQRRFDNSADAVEQRAAEIAFAAVGQDRDDRFARELRFLGKAASNRRGGATRDAA